MPASIFACATSLKYPVRKPAEAPDKRPPGNRVDQAGVALRLLVNRHTRQQQRHKPQARPNTAVLTLVPDIGEPSER